MVEVPSIGDVLLLSQLAWRIGCAFTAGRLSAPPEFHEVENELKTLTKSLDLLAEALDDDNIILARADDKAKIGVTKVLSNCQQCLEDLNAFVARYQEVAPPEGEVGTRGIQSVKTWKPILLKNWRSVWWTTAGGSIQALRNTLHLHVNFVNLTMDALQSRSLSRLGQTVESIVTQLDKINGLAESAMDSRIEQIQHLMTDMASRTGSETDGVALSPKEQMNPGLDEPSSAENLTSYDPFHTRGSSTGGSSDGYRLESNTKFSIDVTQNFSLDDIRGRSVHPRPPDTDPGPPLSRSTHEYDYISETAVVTDAQPTPAGASVDGEVPEFPSPRKYVPHPWSSYSYPTPLLDRTSSQVSSEFSLHEAPLLRRPSDESIEPIISDVHEVNHPSVELSRSTSTVSQQKEFERELFRDTAILCEAPGSCIEYVLQSDDGKAMMVKVATDCQIILLRKRDVQLDGTANFITSVWGISDDRSIRMQQTLTDGDEVIPYTVWDSTKKVSLTVPSLLRFYKASHAMKVLDTAKTNWVNYMFKDEQGANLFQSSLMGKTLLLTVRTNKTLRVHDGITGTFAYQEKMCALENLRIWKDQDSNGVLAMIHYTPQFRDGYMTFYLNSQRDRVRITDAGDRYVKLKGLNISIEKPSRRRGPSSSNPAFSSPVIPSNQQQQQQQQPLLQLPSPQLQNSVGEAAAADCAASKSTGTTKGPKPPKKVTSARLEFTAEGDKRMFLEKFREVQGFFYAG